jgi:peroxiredoxin
MSDQKLGIGATFPSLTLKLVSGENLVVPSGMDAKYRVVLFYRGHW